MTFIHNPGTDRLRRGAQKTGLCAHAQLVLLYAGTVTLPEGIEMVMPGDNVTANFELIAPVAMESGLRFALREGGRTVGAGVVSEVTA